MRVVAITCSFFWTMRGIYTMAIRIDKSWSNNPTLINPILWSLMFFWFFEFIPTIASLYFMLIPTSKPAHHYRLNTVQRFIFFFCFVFFFIVLFGQHTDTKKKQILDTAGQWLSNSERITLEKHCNCLIYCHCLINLKIYTFFTIFITKHFFTLLIN